MKQFNYSFLTSTTSCRSSLLGSNNINKLNNLLWNVGNIHPNNLKTFSTSKQLSSEVKRILIVGGGAAGLNCTKFAQSKALSLLKSNKNQKIEILLLERKPQCGRKIIMSGGSRCNIFPHESKWLSFKKENDLELKYFSSRPDILFQILKTWPIEQQKAYFEKELKIPLELEVESGKYFPQSNDAKDVLDAFLKSISERSNDRVKVSILNNCDVKGLEKTDQGWNVNFKLNDRDNQSLSCKSVVMCTGGLSVINSDGVGVQLLSQLGHSIVPMYPALTPLVSDSKVKLIHKELSGLTIPNVILTVCLENGSDKKIIYQMEEPKGFLFTHAGYSGPACLNPSHATIPGLYNFETQSMNNILIENSIQSSSLIERSHIEKLVFHSPSKPTNQLKLYVNWTPLISAQEWERKFQQAKQKNSKLVLKNFIHKNSEPNFLPIRLVQLITDSLSMSDLVVSKLSNDQRRTIISHLTSFPLDIGGNKGFKMAEVTGGGVDLSQINIPSMESKIHPNLFLCGEVLDAFGRIGGFNFALAWITSRLAEPTPIEKLFSAIKDHQDDAFETVQSILSNLVKTVRDLNLRNDDNVPVLFQICSTPNCSKILKLIIEHVDVNLIYNEKTALELVVSDNSEEYILTLLESDKVDVNIHNPFTEYIQNSMKTSKFSKRIVSTFIEKKAILESKLYQEAVILLLGKETSPPSDEETVGETDEDERTVIYYSSPEQVENLERIILKSFNKILENVESSDFIKKIDIFRYILKREANYRTMQEYSKHNLLQFISRKLVNNMLTENLSACYYFSHALDFDHKIKKNVLFYDPGRSKEFLELSKYEEMKNGREVIVVDLNVDYSLVEIIQRAKKLLIEIKVEFPQDFLSKFYTELSKFVSNELGGPELSVDEHRKHLDSLTVGNPRVALGKIKKGLCRHRALLFKVICDDLHCADPKIKCRLLRGNYNGSHAWNEVEDEYHVKYIIDSMQCPGELVVDSNEYVSEPSKLLDVVYEREFNPTQQFPVLEDNAEIIGQGGQGHVYSVIEEEKKYAVKLIQEPPNDEIYIMSYVNHPNIVKLFNYRSNSHQTNMLLEMMDTDLESYITNDFQQLGEEQKIAEILIILLSISYAMEYLHNRNIIHKDLKPANILLKFGMCENQKVLTEVKLGDFGVSEVVAKTIGKPKRSGTIRYMEPSLRNGSATPYTNQKALDIYSFAVVFHDLLFPEKLDTKAVLTVSEDLKIDKTKYPQYSGVMKLLLLQAKILLNSFPTPNSNSVKGFKEISLRLIKILRRFHETQEINQIFKPKSQ